jgi:hypothetical protein
MLERGSPLDIKIYALNGSLVQQIHEDNVSAGINAMSVNTSSLKSGTYLIHVKAGTSSFSQKMVVVN